MAIFSFGMNMSWWFETFLFFNMFNFDSLWKWNQPQAQRARAVTGLRKELTHEPIQRQCQVLAQLISGTHTCEPGFWIGLRSVWSNTLEMLKEMIRMRERSKVERVWAEFLPPSCRGFCRRRVPWGSHQVILNTIQVVGTLQLRGNRGLVSYVY